MDKAHRAKTGDAEIDPLDLLIPKPIGWKARLAIGCSISIAALMLGLGFGQGYLYPNPLRADFEVSEAVVVPAEFGDGDDVYVQIMLKNTSWRDVRLTSLRVDSPDWKRMGSFGEPLDTALVAPEEDAYGMGASGYLSKKYWGEEGSKPGETGSRYELVTVGLQELPIEIKAGESALVAFVAQAEDCNEQRLEWDAIEADFEFARGSTRLPITRTERFTFVEQLSIETVNRDSDENISPNRVSQNLHSALCEAVA